VTEEPKPVGSGRFRDRSQDSHWVLGPSCSSSLSLRQEPGLGSSSDSNELTALKSQTDPPLSPGHHSLCPGVAQRDAPFKENGWRSSIVACMGSATPAELFPRHQSASDVTRITCEAAPHSTACLLSARCAIRGSWQTKSALHTRRRPGEGPPSVCGSVHAAARMRSSGFWVFTPITSR
jgi:hypothetical protein